jgi:hypothetical protein
MRTISRNDGRMLATISQQQCGTFRIILPTEEDGSLECCADELDRLIDALDQEAVEYHCTEHRSIVAKETQS